MPLVVRKSVLFYNKNDKCNTVPQIYVEIT